MVDLLIKMLESATRRLRRWAWYAKSDIKLITNYCYTLENKQEIEGFYFYSKARFSKQYQFHSQIEIKDVDIILSHVQKAKKDRRSLELTIHSNLGTEVFYIWKSCLDTAERELLDLIEEVAIKNGNIVH